MTDAAPDTDPVRPTTPTYSVTPLAGPTVPYSVSDADPVPEASVAAARSRRRRLGLLIGGIAAASLLMLAAAFGGGVVVGTHLGDHRPGLATVQGGVPGSGPGGSAGQPHQGPRGQDDQGQGGDSSRDGSSGDDTGS